MEGEISDLKDQLKETRDQMLDFQQQLMRREEELNQALNRVEEEAAGRSVMAKQLRELDSQFKDVSDDLEAEKQLRTKADRMRRDREEVFSFFLFLFLFLFVAYCCFCLFVSFLLYYFLFAK